MTPQEVATRVAEIRELADVGSYEAPHVAEDSLYRDVLTAIANGTCKQPAKCARVALTTMDMVFPRWCS